MEEANDTAKDNKQDERYDFDDYATYPYVNLGTLVLDGRNQGANATQYNAPTTETAAPQTLVGYRYALTTYSNGGLYLTRNEGETNNKQLLYLSDAQTKHNTWNAYTSNNALQVVAADGTTLTKALFTVVDDQHVYYNVEESTLYKVEGGEKVVMQQTGVPFPERETPTVYLAGMDEDCRKKAFSLACVLRAANVKAEIDHMERSIKAQFKYADKIGAKYVAVIGGNELAEGVVNVKNMQTGETERVAFDDLKAYFQGK